MADDGWSRALVASSGATVSAARVDDELRALVHEAGGASLSLVRMEQLASHRASEVREVIAARRDVSLALQALLVHDRRRGVRVALASNPALTLPIARVLGRDKDPAVLKALARSDGAHREVLEILAAHRREEVAHLARRALAGAGAAEAPQRAVAGEIEEGARDDARRRRLAAPESPVGQRVSRTLAPRPNVARPAR